MEDKVHGASTQTGPAVGPKLEVVAGENAGEVFKVGFKTNLGRERDNDIVLLDPKTSRYHAQISLEQGQWVLKDQGSANGTFLNGVQITDSAPLKAGDRIRFGETELMFKLPVAAGAEEASPRDALATPPPSVPPTLAPNQPAKSRKSALVWVAGAFILLVCFVAVFAIYLVVSRISFSGSTAENIPPPDEKGISGNNDQITPAPTAPPDTAPTPELVLVYEDDFSDSFGGWDDAFDTYTRKVYGNNRYQIEVNASNLVAWGLANKGVGDFEIEVEARQEDGDVKNSYGLLFRFIDRDNFYRFDISGDGYYLLSKFVDGEWVTLVDWTQSEFVNQGNADNTLKVAAFGPKITVWVNGQQLASITDNSLTEGNFGFFAGTFAEPYTWVSFDNMKLWTPPGASIAVIPTATRPGGATGVEPVTPTPPAPTVPPTATPVPEPAEEPAEELAEELAEEPIEEGEAPAESTQLSPVATPTATAAPSPVPTATPVPLPEYASRDQTLGRGEVEVTGRIVFPVYDDERSVYDIYIADVADGENLQLVQESASQPGLSPDGTEFAYRSWQADRRGLFARPLDGDDTNAWNFDPFFEAARPQFSPADSSLMYFSRTGGDAPATYRVIDGVSQVMRREAFPIQGKSPKWSPDGQQFVYSSCLGSACGVILSNIDGGAPLLLTDQPSDTNPEISPDGEQVVFMSERGGNWEIYRVDITGENLIALTSDSSGDGLPTWSPDGSKIAFVSNRDGEWAVWTMNPDGGGKRRQFVIEGRVDGMVRHDVANSFGWVEENIDWIP